MYIYVCECAEDVGRGCSVVVVVGGRDRRSIVSDGGASASGGSGAIPVCGRQDFALVRACLVLAASQERVSRGKV